MKTKQVNLNDFHGHPHPASKLFRTLELLAVHNAEKRHVFKQPSMDLGCGDGYLSSILFDDKFTYGLDNDEAGEVKIAIKTKRYKNVLTEFAENMSIKRNTLGFVFSNSVIEHIPNNEAVLSEVHRVLKNGGDFVFTSPSHKFKEYLYISNKLNSFGLNFLGDIYKNYRNNMLNHYHTYSHTEWTKRLRNHGFKVMKHSYYINKSTCMLWDELALEVKLLKLVNKNAEKVVFDKYRDQIEQFIVKDKVVGSAGASLLIHAVKV